MKTISLSALIAAALLGSGVVCAASTDGLQNTECVEGNASSDLYAEKSEVKHAELFTLDYHGTYKVINNLSTKSTYVLYQCGTDKPDTEADAYIPVPVSSAAAWSTSAAIMMEALGVQDDIKNLGTAPSIVSACLQKLLEDTIKPFDEGNSTSTDDAEQKNTVVFDMPGTGDAANNTVYTTEYLETSALGRSEWLKFFAAFFNAEERANKLFGDIESNYECTATKATEEYDDLRPVIAWTSYAAPSEFNNNTAYWQISIADYKYDLVRDAGARMLNTTGDQDAMFDSAAAFLDALEEVDIIIDESFVSYEYDDLLKKYGVEDPDNVDYSWVTSKRVFRPDRLQSTSGGLDWFEAPVVFADALLQDLVGVAHPKAIKDGFEPTWFRNLADDDRVTVVTADDCKDTEAQRSDPAVSCKDLDFPEANPDDPEYEGVDADQTEDMIYDLSQSEIINDDEAGDNTGGAASICATVSVWSMAAAAAAALLAGGYW
ncbi:hypothetical protein GGF46_004043 [Coemansia sp. RSA 552]|nr:hypothetical protein GGF46_004043 [Coemansia sp. RSA 552]